MKTLSLVRSNTKVTEIKGSHVIYMTQPDAVAEVIIEAAVNASKERLILN